MRSRKLLVGMVAGAIALVAPGAAQAATKTVTMGPPASPERTAIRKDSGDVNDFFPRRIAIHRNDSVRFAPRGVHTVDIPASGMTQLPWFAATADNVSGQQDAAGKPFWFNGQDEIFFHPDLTKAPPAQPVYNGSRRVEGGVAPGPKGRALTVKFTQVGTYAYYCNLHQGMSGNVVVRGPKSKIASRKTDASRVKAQLKNALRIFKPLKESGVPANTVEVGAAGQEGVEYYGFLPEPRGVQVGETVTFRVSVSSFEAHTATFGPESYLDPLRASFGGDGPFDPRAFYPSERGRAVAAYTSGLHGNGFWNSGVLDNSTITSRPSSKRLRFTAPGKYTLYCLIHPNMRGTVTVYEKVRDGRTGGITPP